MLLNQSTLLFGIKAEDVKPIDLIAKAFENNQRLRSMFDTELNPQKSLRHLITYCYSLVKKENQVFMSEDKNTVMLYYRKSRLQKNWVDWLNYLYLALKVIGVKRLPAIHKREKIVSRIRETEMLKHDEKDYFYIWFIAQSKKASPRDLYKARLFVQEKADALELPIYIETTDPRLKRIYESRGFHIYNSYKEKTSDVTVWFCRYSADA